MNKFHCRSNISENSSLGCCEPRVERMSGWGVNSWMLSDMLSLEQEHTKHHSLDSGRETTKYQKNDKRKSRRLKVKTCFIDCNPRVSLKPIQRACLVLENIKQASTTASAATCGSSPPTWPLKMALKVGFHNSRATELRDDDSGSRLWKKAKKLKST